MPTGTIDSAIFRDIFGTEAMRQRVVGRQPHPEVSRLRGRRWRARRPSSASSRRRPATEILKHCKVDQFDIDKLKKQTERIGYPVLPVVAQLVELCKGDLGEWCHWGATTQDITDTATIMQIRESARPDREGHQRHFRRARRAREEISRHADGRPQQPAAGGADHLRLQVRDLSRRLRAPQGAAQAAARARAGVRVRRRRRHAVLARQGRPAHAGRAGEGARPRASRRSPGTPCTTASPRSAASSASSPAPAARSRST